MKPGYWVAAILVRPPYAPQLWFCALKIMNLKPTNWLWKILAAFQPIIVLSLLLQTELSPTANWSYQDGRLKFLGIKNEIIETRASLFLRSVEVEVEVHILDVLAMSVCLKFIVCGIFRTYLNQIDGALFKRLLENQNQRAVLSQPHGQANYHF